VDLSVVVASFNSVEPLEELLTSLTSELERVSASSEVIVVDNGSTDGTSSMVSAKFPKVKLITNPVNEYFVGGVNRGYAESSGAFALVTGADVQVVQGSISRLLSFMNSSSKAAAASCRIVTPSNGRLQLTGGAFLTLTSDLFEWTRLGLLFPGIKRQLCSLRYMDGWDRSDTREVDVIVADFMIFRRAAVEAVGGFFDNRFSMYFAEDELCWRLKKWGWKIYHLGDIFVYHRGRFAFDKMDQGFLSELSLKDRLVYHRLVLGFVSSLLFRIALRIDGLLTRALGIRRTQ